MLYRKKTSIWMLSFVLLFASVFSMGGKMSAASANINLEVKSALLVDAKTGKILYKMNENEALPPASMTKMMTELLVLEAVENGTKSWDDIVKTDEYGFFMGKYGGSRVFLTQGDEHTVKELYEAMAIYSANDATVMLAQYMAGSEENFVNLMNQRAKELGMDSTHFQTSSGFPVEELKQYAPNISGEHVMSARDVAILAREIITKHPDALKISSIPKKNFREGTAKQMLMANWNWMLPSLVYAYEGMDGLKTGHTDQAGYCFTGTAERNGVRLISVVFGATSEAKRFGETKKLMDYGFSNYKPQTLISKDSSITGYEKVNVQKGKNLQVEAVAEKDLTYLVRTGEEKDYKPVVTIADAVAPIKKGQSIGTVSVEYTGTDNNEFLRPTDEKNTQINLVAKTDVEEASWIRLFFRAIANFIGGTIGKIGGKS